MVDLKELAENILMDLTNNGSISDILLKTIIFASKKGDIELLAWVSKELNGYEEEKPPRYRILNCGLKVGVFVPSRGTARVDFPIDMIENENVRNRLSSLPCHMSITKIDNLCKDASNDGTIRVKVPVYAYHFFFEFINGDIQDTYQYTTTAALSQILFDLKSVFIDSLLNVSSEEDINFNTFIKTNPQMITINNNSVIMNTDSGDINAQGATVVTGDNNTIGADNKQELLKILAEIDKIATAQPNTDYDEVSKDIKSELQKEHPNKKVLKRFFSAIPTFLSGVASSITGNGITELIKYALTLL